MSWIFYLGFFGGLVFESLPDCKLHGNMEMKLLISLALLLLIGCGEEYRTGAPGATGAAGQSGVSPKINLVRFTSDNSICFSGSGVIIQVTDPQSQYFNASVITESVVCDGIAGSNGQNAVLDNFNVIEVIDPCGDTAGIIDEVILKLENGQLLASFSDDVNGKNTRLSLIPPGSYIDTDGSNCHFTVHNDGSVTW